MFIVTKVVDTIRIPPNMLSIPSIQAIHAEMDRRYPNKVLMDVGLVICRYGDCLKIGDGICVNGDGGAHFECLVKLLIFRPFVDEVCTGKIKKSTPEGIQVSLGFFEDITIPPYWMLRPSKFESKSGLWIWTPNYEEEEDEEEAEEETKDDNKTKDKEEEKTEEAEKVEPATVASDPQVAAVATITTTAEDDNRYEMMIGSEIRFKIKSINFTQITNTAKGMQATTTTTAQASLHPDMTGKNSDGSSHSMRRQGSGESGVSQQPVRKRSVSVDLTESQNMPATMHVVASICEDGLGLISWWNAPEEDGEEDEDKTAEI